MADPDPQDPLPEASFPWRRALCYAISAICFAVIWWKLAPRIPSGDVLAAMQSLLLFNFGVITFYMGGASAEDIAKLLAHVKLRIGKDKES